ncbi:MAG: ABC transporter permease [Candidatus Aminicenantes bacterium]|nr:ABC transporter permease [Candidatus Aminicenantes bacterium]
MKNIILLVRKDFRRKWKNPIVIIGFMLIPVLFTAIFGMVFNPSEDFTLPEIIILVADNDGSLVSNFLTTAMSQGELKKMAVLKPVGDEEQGRKLLNKDKASALLVIPAEFGRRVLEGKKAEVLLLKNPSEQFLPLIAEEIVDTTTLILSGLLSVFSDEIGLIRRGMEMESIPDTDIAALSVRIRKRVEGLAAYILPPVISLKQVTIKEEGEAKEDSPWSIYSYILPAMSILFLLFICNVVFEDILREKEAGTLLRLSISPLTMTEFIWSKIVVSALIGILCTGVLVAMGAFIFSINWGNAFSVLLIILCLNILIAGFIAFLYSFIRTERQAGAVLSPIILVMSLIGGSMVPVSNFPPFIQKLSTLTINYWGMEAFRYSIEGKTLLNMLPILLGMLAVGFLLSFTASALIQNKLKKGLCQ